MTDKTKRYADLVRLLNQYSLEYHSLDAPSVSDAVYDSLFAELKQIEAEHPQQAGSPLHHLCLFESFVRLR